MSTQAKQYQSLAIGLAAAIGAIAGILVASFRFKLPKPPKGG